MKSFSARTGVDFFFEFCMMSFIIREMRVRSVVTLLALLPEAGKSGESIIGVGKLGVVKCPNFGKAN